MSRWSLIQDRAKGSHLPGIWQCGDTKNQVLLCPGSMGHEVGAMQLIGDKNPVPRNTTQDVKDPANGIGVQ